MSTGVGPGVLALPARVGPDQMSTPNRHWRRPRIWPRTSNDGGPNPRERALRRAHNLDIRTRRRGALGAPLLLWASKPVPATFGRRACACWATETRAVTHVSATPGREGDEWRIGSLPESQVVKCEGGVEVGVLACEVGDVDDVGTCWLEDGPVA